MKARNLIFAGFVFAAASGFAQSIDSSIHVNQFPGSTVAAKLPMPLRRARRTSRSPAFSCLIRRSRR